MPRPTTSRVTLLLGAFLLGAPAAARAADKVDFARDVLPILSDNCFTCHGPDKAARKADLRLDVREEAVKAEVIIPGQPGKSPLIRRIFSDNPRRQMPPPQAHKTLTSAQKGTLRRWIAEGAPYADHWAFVSPRRPPLPAVKGADSAWPRNAIDHFVLARLLRERLRPAPQADRATLLRRVTLDLTGIPPTPEEVDAFLADSSPRAYEKAVDRLLASPRYGERMVWEWLDAARYAD